MDPVIRKAPPGDLRLYAVYEHEVDRFARGSTASLLLNFGLFFSGVFVSSSTTLMSAPPLGQKTFDFFVIRTVIAAIAGAVLLALWWSMRGRGEDLVETIRNRLPEIPPGIQDLTVESPSAEY